MASVAFRITSHEFDKVESSAEKLEIRWVSVCFSSVPVEDGDTAGLCPVAVEGQGSQASLDLA